MSHAQNAIGSGLNILNQPQLPQPANNQHNQQQVPQHQQHNGSTNTNVQAAAPPAAPAATAPTKKKKKKKASKEKKPRPKPGEIRLTTALDGSTLFCCPECQMAYPERGLLEQHLVGHNLERR